ncbi:MAG: DNA/RNA non-specific endonuclease [Comamonadaceae bacterium]|nr:MAG: DNA/RNA non-specific endonuclease [Comamonadaceae bacterium]
MPAPKKKTRQKSARRPAKNRSGSGSRSGFWRALVLSAGASFTALSCALNPQWTASPALDTPWMRELVARLGPWLSARLPASSTSRPEAKPSADARPPAGSAPHATGEGQFSACRDVFPLERPPQLLYAPPELHALCFDSFAVLYNAATKTPVYVAERLSRAGLVAAQSIARTDRFYPEARLPGRARAQLDDYRGSGYARGHMAPAADMPNANAMAQSFSLANIVPQDQNHNSGPWNQIERDTRQYVMRARGDVYVFTGPAFLNSITTRIGASGVAVPSHLFKLVHDPATGRSWAHWHHNQPGRQAMKPIAYQTLVNQVGIDFLHSAD